MNKEQWDTSYQNNLTPWREPFEINDVLEHAGVTKGSALDLGCGTGEWGIALAEKGFEVEGLDFSTEALKIARSLSDKVRWVEWDLEKLNEYAFKHDSYDLILDHKVLAFIENKEKYLDTIASRLSGVYVLTVFHEHDKKGAINVPKDLFDKLIPPRFKISYSQSWNPRQGKVFATYWLKVDD